jgi:bifunctional non-homologous end joining protein LigD
MPLEEYRRKRDFAKTPEPAGSGQGEAGLTYVIQKHAASRLHWDFRIELGGVLLSWAVPKGPSLDPAEKRLAVHVEDHPLDYGGFEGTIPEGEYGGGTVMLWDRGTWRPDHGDPAEHLAQGHLKFELLGERLHGRWMLVRTKGFGGKQDSWLLFKEHDGFERAHADFDATAEWTTSIATGRTMEQIAADPAPSAELVAEKTAPPERLAARDVPGARKAGMPQSIDVQLAALREAAPQGDEWLHEVKFDGYRVVAFLREGHARLVSRNGNDWTDRFAPVAAAVEGLDAKTAVIDGEVVVLRADGTSDFQALQNLARAGGEAALYYYAFDLLFLDGYDLRGATLEDRKRALAGVLGEAKGVVRYSDHARGSGDAVYAKACELSLEGVVSKRADSAYAGGRQRSWVKSKCLLRQEFVVAGYTAPGGSRSHFGALVLGVNEGGRLRYAGRVGTGFSEAALADIAARLHGTERPDPTVADPPTGTAAQGVQWVEPRLVAEVAFAEWTGGGDLRHPRFLGLRDDKLPGDVVEERPADAAAAAKPLVAGVLLSNPDRVLWPDVPLTKLQLARYYEQVAERMLPHITGRPLSLVRCPSGVGGECFYHKHIANFPTSVDTVDVFEPEAGRTAPYGTVSDLAGIVGLVQMAALEIHPWGARNDDVDRPDRLVFDLDPDPDLPFTAVAATAQLLRSELSRLGLESWLKTTGGKGLHVVVPVERRNDWGSARDFTRAFVDHIVAMQPDLFTGNMRKTQRGRRIFIDYLRNARGATAIAPYSTRARAGAPVAVPLSWDEIGGATVRPEFTVLTLPARLAETPVDPWADLAHPPRQSITRKARQRLGLDEDARLALD